MFHGFEYENYFEADTSGKLSWILRTEDFILGIDDGRKRFVNEVTALGKAFAIAVPHDKAMDVKDEVSFFQAVKARLCKFDSTGEGSTDEKIETTIRQVIDHALVSEKVIDIFDAAGIKKPDISILSKEFLMELKGMEHKNIALEVLRKLLSDEIKERYLGDKAAVTACRQRLDTAQLSSRHYRIQKKYYELCARMAYEEKAYAEAARYEGKLYQIDEEIIRKLNTKTLDEVILHDEMRKDREAKAAYESKLHLLIGLMGLGLGSLWAIYLAKRKKYLQRKWELAQQIEVLQKLNDTQATLKDELKKFILRDFEIAKKIALLQQLDSDNDRRFLSKLHKLFLADANSLLSLDWPAFYQHVDIYKQDFHARLTAAYSFLSEKEVQLSCLLTVGFNTSEIAAIWSQSVYSVHKYKTGIRKKTGMAEGADLVAEFSRFLGLQG